MRTRWWLAAIWAAFAVRLAFYATAFPIWEGFDEWAYFSVVRYTAAGHLLAPRDLSVPRDVAVSLQLAPVAPAISNLPGVVTHDEFWRLPAAERERREREFRAIPREFQAQSGQIGAYEALQPPFYFWIASPALWVFRNASLPTQVFALRWLAVLFGSCAIPLIFLIGRSVFADDAVALGCAVVASLMPELAITTARVSNECVAIPIYTALTWVAVRRRSWIALGLLLGLGLITKAYFIAAAAGVALAFWAPWAFLIAAAMSGWWYLRNVFTTGTLSGLSEAAQLRDASTLSLARSAASLPWRTAIDSILFSHLYFGGWSGLTVRSWMYHLFYVVIAIAAVGLFARRNKPEIRRLAFIYGAFWLAQLYNVALIFATKHVPTSMGWYLYAVIGAQTALCVAGLRKLIGGCAIGLGAALFGLLDLYAMNAIALPYYTGMLSRKANGALAGVKIGEIQPAELFERLTAFKPECISSGVLIALWAAYILATLALIAGGMRLARAGHESASR